MSAKYSGYIIVILAISLLITISSGQDNQDRLKVQFPSTYSYPYSRISSRDFLSIEDIARINREHGRDTAHRQRTTFYSGTTSQPVYRTVERESDLDRQLKQRVTRPTLRPDIQRPSMGEPRTGTR